MKIIPEDEFAPGTHVKRVIGKFGRAVTWHTSGKSIACRVLSVAEVGGIPVLRCAWSFVDSTSQKGSSERHGATPLS